MLTEVTQPKKQPRTKLPKTKVESFADCDENFENIVVVVDKFVDEMRENREYTQKNLTKLATETSASIEKLSEILTTVTKQRETVGSIAIIAICGIGLLVKELWDFGEHIYKLVHG